MSHEIKPQQADSFDHSSGDLVSPRVSIERVVTKTLTMVHEHFDTEARPDQALYELAHCAEEAHLYDYARADSLDDLIERVPAVGELIDELRQTASSVIEQAEETVPPSTVVEALGIAADITGNKELLADTLSVLEGADEEKYDSLRVALQKALDENVLFAQAKRITEKEFREKKLAQIVPPSQRPAYDADSSYAFLSLPGKLSEVPGHITMSRVAMSSFDDLYATQKRADVYTPTYDPDRHLTTDEIRRLQDALADTALGYETDTTL